MQCCDTRFNSRILTKNWAWGGIVEDNLLPNLHVDRIVTTNHHAAILPAIAATQDLLLHH